MTVVNVDTAAAATKVKEKTMKPLKELMYLQTSSAGGCCGSCFLSNFGIRPVRVDQDLTSLMHRQRKVDNDSPIIKTGGHFLAYLNGTQKGYLHEVMCKHGFKVVDSVVNLNSCNNIYLYVWNRAENE
jgi:hypothetical protein